jgi:hypothetical protein
LKNRDSGFLAHLKPTFVLYYILSKIALVASATSADKLIFISMYYAPGMKRKKANSVWLAISLTKKPSPAQKKEV